MPHEVFQGPVREAVAVLERAVAVFANAIGDPLVVIIEERGRSIRYPERSPEVVRVLKAVRVVSALNACAALLHQGFIIEAEFLMRTVDEFLSDMNFLRRDENGGVGDKQQEYIEDFFAELPSQEEMWQSRKQRPRVPRRRRRLAEEGRFLAEVTGDPHTITAVSNNLLELADRYVHGAFVGIMELYSDHGYSTCGVRHAEQVRTHQGQCVAFVHRSLNVLAVLAHDLGLRDLMDELVENRRWFEKSAQYSGEQ